MPKLRFAPLIRVSTEKQADKGQSLKTQRSQILDAVEAQDGGIIPENCWKYYGQEHGTPQYEREMLDQLLEDAGKDLFDAIIVADPSRWSRDNLKNEEGLRILKLHEVRFFVLSKEYDLNQPSEYFFLVLNAAINQMKAASQNQTSILNRINRAKEGRPSAGKLPFGRTWSEKEGWGVDEKKKRTIERVAVRYLAGESLMEIALSIGMNTAGLHRILKEKSGSKWEIHFKKPDLKIDETVEFIIPHLLEEETILAIRERGEANRTYNHGELKNRYLLSRMIFCPTCGRALTGISIPIICLFNLFVCLLRGCYGLRVPGCGV